MQSIILPLLILFIPCILLTIYGIIIKKRIKLKLVIAAILFFILGLIAPWTATLVSARGLLENLPEGYGCVIGSAVFLYGGYLLNIIGIPVILILFLFLKGKNKKHFK